MADTTMEALQKIVSPRTYSKGEYICFESQPGDEMYLVLSGSVGIYSNTALGDTQLTTTANAGDFFSEAALFDKSLHSAWCVALENCACAAVGRRHLRQLIVNCPEIAEKMLTAFSQRSRELSDSLYKIRNPATAIRYKSFPMPQPNHSHNLSKPEKAAQYVELCRADCPVCHESVILHNIKVGSLPNAQILPNQRRRYDGFEPLWYYIWSCPQCGYTNYYQEFFRSYSSTLGEMRQVIADRSSCRSTFGCKSSFDELAYSYYCAIHTNDCLNSSNTLLLGRLWMYLSWLYGDVGDSQLQAAARYNAIDYYLVTYLQNSRLIMSEESRQLCAFILGELYFEEGDLPNAKTYFYEALKCAGKALKQAASDRLYDIRELPDRLIIR